MSQRAWWACWFGAAASYWYGTFAPDAFFRGLGTLVWLGMGGVVVVGWVRWWRAYGRHRCEWLSCRRRSWARVQLSVNDRDRGSTYLCRDHLAKMRALAEVTARIREAANN